jgi:hypothetical protein
MLLFGGMGLYNSNGKHVLVKINEDFSKIRKMFLLGQFVTLWMFLILQLVYLDGSLEHIMVYLYLTKLIVIVIEYNILI